MVNGDGPGVGAAISSHPDIDMVSFTGSTRAGVDVAKNAAATVKRVTQELGGKSPNIVLDDDAFARSVVSGVTVMMLNTGQSCNAPSRMLVPKSRMAEALSLARDVAEKVVVGDLDNKASIGPVASKAQFDKIQGLIQKGIDEGATVVTGGPGRPDGLDAGYYVKPTVFADVTNDMTIAREEIFGPVLCVLGYDDIDQAVEIANDTDYGLSGYVSSGDLEQGARGRSPDPGGQRGDQPCLRHQRALRRLQAQRQRPGVERVRLPRVPGDQGDPGVRARKGIAHARSSKALAGRPLTSSARRDAPR